MAEAFFGIRASDLFSHSCFDIRHSDSHHFPFATAPTDVGGVGATRLIFVFVPSTQNIPPMLPIKANAASTVQRPGRIGLR